MFRIAAGDEQEFRPIVVNGRGDKLVRGPIHDPMQCAAIRIVTGDGFVAGKHHLSAPREITNEWDAIAASAVLTRRFPESPPGLPVERNDVGITVVVAVHDHFVAVENR